MGGSLGAHRLRGPAVTTILADAHRRPLKSLRISVTDRCNMRCSYCMPEDHYLWLPRSSILTFEEFARLAGVFAGLGVDEIRLTGGEPLLRRDLPALVALLRRDPRITDLSLTTNGVLLAEHAAALFAAGLGRVTVSLDTLRPDRLRAFSQSAQHADILSGIDAAQRAGFGRLKVNSVVIRGVNEDELCDLIAFGRDRGVEVRFIEYMDVGGATRWSQRQVVRRDEMLEIIFRRLGPVEPVDPGAVSAPARRYRLPDGSTFGIIASVTAPFCGDCDRSRLTADGNWLLCLYAEGGIDLREAVRGGASDSELGALIAAAWRGRRDRGAEERRGLPSREALYQVDGLRADPHLEMHTRGG